jgi:hypothetical protein
MRILEIGLQPEVRTGDRTSSVALPEIHLPKPEKKSLFVDV